MPDVNKQAHAIAAYKIRSAEEAREKGKAGGKASGESRRAKAETKRLLEAALSLKPNVQGTSLANLPSEMDVSTYFNAIIANLVVSASHGKTSSINAIIKLLD